MKKVLAWLLLITLVLGAFAGCKGKDQPEVTEPTVKGAGAVDAIEYLKGFYTDSGKKTPVDYTRFGIVRVGGIAFDVVWTVDVSEDLVKVVANDDGTVTIDINEECEADTEYTLTATVTDAQGQTASHSWTYILPEGVDMVEVVKAAYALQPGESLPYESRLIGKIVSIDAVWTDDYQNVTVTIAVEGAEDMPIKCYRMKANDSTLEAAKNLLVGNIITVSGTLKNYEGTIEFDAGCILEKVEKGDAVEAPTDPVQIVKEAYALPQNAALPYAAVLTGTVTAIDSPYDPQYGNLSVVITIEGAEQYPILCYRLKGTDVEKIAIGDLITVNGIIKNYKGTIEYDAGCVMTNRVSGGGVAQGPSSDPNKIIPDALALKPGEKLPYRATLTGEIYSVDNAYDPNYGNVTVTILVQGYKIQCYRMVGDGIDQIRESDTITVSGVIENYNGKLEFGAKCTLDNWVVGPRTINYGSIKEGVAYRLYMEQNGIGKTLYFDGTASSSGKLQTTVKGSEGADVFAEKVSGRGMRFYYMNGNTKTYLEIEEYTNDSGKQRGRVKVTTEPTCYWVYDREAGVYVVNLPTAGKYFLGTYSTYDNISASWLGYIIDANASTVGVSQFVAKFIEADQLPEDDQPSQGGSSGEMITAPEVGVPYKWGIEQGNKGVNLYFTGTMSGYYGATSENINDGVDVYLEETNGGYYITFNDASGAKKYITVVIKVDGEKTHRNFTIANAPSQVYTYDSQYNTLVTEIDGEKLYFGTYDNYNTFSVSYFSKIGSSFPAHFYVAGEGGEVEPQPTEPSAPQETIPVAVDELLDGYQVVIYAPAYNKALSADKVSAGSYYNKGTDITIANGEMSGYGVAEIWTVVDNGNGTYSFAYDGQNIGLAEQYSSMNLGAIYDEWTLEYLGNGLYNIKNVGRGNYIEWYAEKDNWSTHTTSSVATNDLFQLSIYVIGLGLVGDTTEAPEPTEPDVTVPSGEGFNKVTSASQFTSGKYVMVVDTGYAPGVFASGWLSAVQPTISGNTVTDAKGGIWTLTVNGNSVTITDANGIAIAPKGGNTNGVTEKSYDWQWSFADGKFVFAGTGSDTVYLASNANTTGEYPGNHRFRGYKTTTVNGNPATYPHQFTLYKMGGEYVEPEVTEPSAPVVTEPSTGVGMITAPATGVAYKWGIEQNGIGKTLYFTGAMNGYYGATSENMEDGVDVILEAANGGYYLSFKDASGAKKYVNVVLNVSGGKTYRNFTIANSASTVYTWNAEYNTLNTDVEGTICYIGTYGTYNTFSVSSMDKIGTSYPSHFYGEGAGEVEPEVTEPSAPVVTEPAASASLQDGDQIVIFAPAYGKALSADKVSEGSFYNKGVDVTYADGVLSGYGAAETWTVVDNGNGTYSFAYNGQNIGLAEEYSSMNLGAIYDEWELISLGGNLYHIKNVGRGNFIEWYDSKGNWSSYTKASDAQFEMSIYIIGKGLLGEAEEPEATQPTAPEATQPSTGSGFNKITTAAEFTSGQYVMIVNTGYAPVAFDNGWLSAAQPTVSGNSVVETAGAIWTLTVNGKSVVITDANGISIAPKGGNANGVTEKSYDWGWTIENGTFIFSGNGEDTVFLASNSSTTGQYPGNHRFRGYKTTTIEKYPAEYPYQFTLYKMGGEYVEPEVTEPVVTEPVVTEPVATEPAGSDGIQNGDKVIIYAPAYGKALSADKVNETSFYNKGVDVTISGGVMSGYGDAEIWTVIDNGNGTYSFANGGQNIGLAEEYSSMNLGAIYDEWEVISLGNGLYHIKNVARGNFMEWYDSKGNWSSYTKASDAQFEMSFYVIGEGTVGGNAPEATEPEATTPSVDAADVSVDFSTIPVGVQYEDETYSLGNGVTLDISHCHMNKQLRIYQDAKNGYDGKAIFSCTSAVKSFTMNMGYRASSMAVYASVDGINWVEITVINHPTKDGYADYTVVMPEGTSYKYFMLDALDAQMRVKTLSIAFKK